MTYSLDFVVELRTVVYWMSAEDTIIKMSRPINDVQSTILFLIC